MRNVIAVFLLALAGATAAGAQSFEGLYRPAGSDWSCDRAELGMDGGAVGFLDSRFYGVENTCEVISARSKAGWIKMTTRCSGEGEEYTDAFSLRVTRDGIEFDRQGNRFVWERCRAAAAAPAAPRNGDWGGGLGQGWYGAGTSDDVGNEIRLACNLGGTPADVAGSISVSIAGRPAPAGTIAFDVDGERVSHIADASGTVTIGDCPDCRAEFAALWERIALGQVLTVIPSTGSGAAFSLRGSMAAMGRDTCAG